MTCRQWVDEGHIGCNAWTDEVSSSCVSWRDDGYQKCSQWADEGSNSCSSWADQGHNDCASQYLNECHWYSPWNCIAGWLCQAWYWVANWVCQAWYWVAKWVCKGWYWVANIVCQVFAYFIKAVCLVWSWFAKLVCVAWETTRCALNDWFGRPRRNPSPIKHVFVLMLKTVRSITCLVFPALRVRTSCPDSSARSTVPAAATIFRGHPSFQAPRLTSN